MGVAANSPPSGPRCAGGIVRRVARARSGVTSEAGRTWTPATPERHSTQREPDQTLDPVDALSSSWSVIGRGTLRHDPTAVCPVPRLNVPSISAFGRQPEPTCTANLTGGRSVAAKGPRYILCVASLGDYRLKAIQKLQDELGTNLAIYSGDAPPQSGIRVLKPGRLGIRAANNRQLPFGVFFQRVPVRLMLRSESVILDLNPRGLHIWALLVVRRAMGKRTALWGHAWPHGGPDSRSEQARRLMRKLATALVAYTWEQANALQSRHPAKEVYAAPNALYSRDEMQFAPDQRRSDFIFSGRLTPEKKPDLLLLAFQAASENMPSARLIFVGDGPMETPLRKLAKTLESKDSIIFTGYVSHYETLKHIYSSGVMSISSGYVGLSAIQSFGFGVGMLVADNEPHSPEIEAVHPHENAEFFRADDANDLSRLLVKTWEEREHWADAGPTIARDCADAYSAEEMAGGLVLGFRGGLV